MAREAVSQRGVARGTLPGLEDTAANEDPVECWLWWSQVFHWRTRVLNMIVVVVWSAGVSRRRKFHGGRLRKVQMTSSWSSDCTDCHCRLSMFKPGKPCPGSCGKKAVCPSCLSYACVAPEDAAIKPLKITAYCKVGPP